MSRRWEHPPEAARAPRTASQARSAIVAWGQELAAGSKFHVEVHLLKPHAKEAILKPDSALDAAPTRCDAPRRLQLRGVLPLALTRACARARLAALVARLRVHRKHAEDVDAELRRASAHLIVRPAHPGISLPQAEETS